MKTILITGASSGIGRALAVQAARAGYEVYAVGRNVRALAALADQVDVEGGTIVTEITDISDPANAPGVIGRAMGAFGRVDILVNNAGAVAVGPIATQTDEALRVQFGTHVIGPLALTREALPALRAARGQVFMLGSGVARIPVGGLGAYPPSKAALRSATSILRRELAPLDIAVTYVDPGAVDTGFMARAGMSGASRNLLVSPELVARKILLAILSRPRVLNVMPLQTVAVQIAELFPAITEVVLELNPSLVGAGPSLAAIDLQRDANGRGEKIALPSAVPLELPPAEETPPAAEPEEPQAVAEPEPEPEPDPEPDPPPVVETIVEDVVAEPEPVVAQPEPVIVELDPVVAEAEPAIEEAAPEFTARWQFEPPEIELEEPAIGVLLPTYDEALLPVPEPAAQHDIEPAATTSSFDAALESLQRRMERAKLMTDFVRALLVVDSVIDVGEAAMKWAGMPNKHERALTSEVCFALAEWGFLAPRADGRYRVLHSADDDPGI